MQRSYWPSFDTSDKYAVSIILMSLHKISRSLFGRDGYERHAFVSRLEPYNFGFVLLAILLVTTRTIAVLTFCFLFFFCGLTARSKKPKGSVS